MSKKQLVAVYGSLLRNMGNHRLLENPGVEFVGEFETEPTYTLYSLGGFPGLHEGGDTSVKMEVYSVDERTNQRLDMLEGYTPGEKATFYDKKSVETPYGTAAVYIYVGQPSADRKVESGDWREYYNTQRYTPTY